MESFFELSVEIRKKFENYEEDQRVKETEEKLKSIFQHYVAPEMKKQKTSLEADAEEPDSGIDASTLTAATSSTASSRPSRSTKTLANKNLKQPKLGTKLRAEVKLEPISETSYKSTNSKVSDKKENDLNSINVKREKLSMVTRGSSNSSRPSDVLEIPNEVNVITISDDDGDNEKMPPPTMYPPKKLPSKKTRKNQEDTASFTTNSSEDSSTQSSETLLAKKTTTKKGKKPKKPVMPIVMVKEEKVEEQINVANDEIRQKRSTKSKDTAEEVTPENGSKNATFESVYEDASDKFASQTSNGLAPCATYVVPSNVLAKNHQDGHSNVQKSNNVVKSKPSYSSIITEDDSDEELPIPKSKKNPKELFNPCIQSPMKAKVAAFEKQALEYSSPAPPTRQTRTKTRQLAKQNGESTSKLPKPTTPSVEIKYPLKEHTPHTLSQLPKGHHPSISSSKVATPVSKVGILNRAPSANSMKVRSRDNSVDDMARAKEAILEKKRKGEERIKRAQMQREAQEKEKLEKVEKLLKAKQEKEAAREALKQKKHQEDLQKQLRALELKREKERKQKAELAEAARIERDQALNKKIAEEKAYLENLKQKREEPKSLLTFDMLQTDDSTDDEEDHSQNRKRRPDPPAWSIRANAKTNIMIQSGLSANTIDMLFSCKPTTPDLAAIFPDIDAKHLKRNSSAMWNTPPRYSQLPKY
ncbi:hypothetical protein Bhyg_01302 [Pseudolycoriella hygida]|uniref:Inner centromere protein ARK-binding domain-containing protein n=1 Tax=Pseudolycoriella hygida TaxID=35572 RepID=A0A9Q0NA11_9DIPT|nr:hypothetical protein Bhyg_01302 [Pseudolycoriella hygida]